MCTHTESISLEERVDSYPEEEGHATGDRFNCNSGENVPICMYQYHYWVCIQSSVWQGTYLQSVTLSLYCFPFG